MKTIIYSKDRTHYYVEEFVCPKCNWISTEKFEEEPKKGWISHSYQYDDNYFRGALPFTFWKVKSGDKERVKDDHELVADYVGCGYHGSTSKAKEE